MLARDQWLDLARKLDWEFSYVSEQEVFPEIISGSPWLPHQAWQEWDEPYRTSYGAYVTTQREKDASIYAVRDAVGRLEDVQKLAPVWPQWAQVACRNVLPWPISLVTWM